MKTNIADTVTRHLLDALVPITSGIQTKLEEHTTALNNATDTQTNLNEKLQQTQAKLDETSQRVASIPKTYSQAASSPPTHPSNPSNANPSYAQIQIKNREEIKKRQVLIEFELSDDLALDNLDEPTLARKMIDSINTVWASAPEPRPDKPKLKTTTLLRNGGLLLELNSPTSAAWVRKEQNRKSFLENLGSGANIKDRSYQVIANFVPIRFNPESNKHLRMYEEHNGLEQNSILKAEWIKPPKDRNERQTVATM